MGIYSGRIFRKFELKVPTRFCPPCLFTDSMKRTGDKLPYTVMGGVGLGDREV